MPSYSQQVVNRFNRGSAAYGRRFPTGQQFGMVDRVMGHNVGRGLLGAGMGVVALGQAGNMAQRLRYRDYTGAAVSGAMAAGAGAGAYLTLMQREAMTKHLQTAGNVLAKNARGARSAGNFMLRNLLR